uniref:Uncharacterized protein n=1 Tax=Glossina brevipalpis TaxID=37001 RepID=A0A1A9X2Q6_9MUSC
MYERKLVVLLITRNMLLYRYCIRRDCRLVSVTTPPTKHTCNLRSIVIKIRLTTSRTEPEWANLIASYLLICAVFLLPASYRFIIRNKKRCFLSKILKTKAFEDIPISETPKTASLKVARSERWDEIIIKTT